MDIDILIPAIVFPFFLPIAILGLYCLISEEDNLNLFGKMQKFLEKQMRNVPVQNVKKEVEAAKTPGASAQGQGPEDIYATALRNLTAQVDDVVGILGKHPRPLVPASPSVMSMARLSTQTAINDGKAPIAAYKKLIDVILFIAQDIALTYLAQTSSLLEDIAVAYSALEEVDQASATKFFHHLLASVKVLRQEIVNENARLGEEMQTLRAHWEDYATEVETEIDMEKNDEVSDGTKARPDSESEKESVFGASSSQLHIAVLLNKTHLILEALREPNCEREHTPIKDDEENCIAEALTTLESAIKDLNNKDAEMKADHTRDIEREPVAELDIYNSRSARKMGFKMLSKEFRKKKGDPLLSVPKSECSNPIRTSNDTFSSASFGNAYDENIGEFDHSKITEAEVLHETFKSCKTEQEHWNAIGDAFAKMKGTPLVREDEIPISSPKIAETESLSNVLEACKTQQHHSDAISNPISDIFANFNRYPIRQTVHEVINIVSPGEAPNHEVNVEVMGTKPIPMPIPERKKAHRGKRGGVKHRKRIQPSSQDISNSTHASLPNVENGYAGAMAEIKGRIENEQAVIKGSMRTEHAVDQRIGFHLGREKLTSLQRARVESEEMVRPGLLKNDKGKEKERSFLRRALAPYPGTAPPVLVDQAVPISTLKQFSSRLSHDPKFLAMDQATLTLISASTPKTTTARQPQTRTHTQETSKQDKQKSLPRVLDEEDELKNMIELTEEVMRKISIQTPAVEPSSSRAEATENSVSNEKPGNDQDGRKGQQRNVISHAENSEYQGVRLDTEREVVEEWIEDAEDEEYQEIDLENEVESERQGRYHSFDLEINDEEEWERI